MAREGGTPLVVAEGKKVLGVIRLNDIVKGASKSVSPNSGNGHKDNDDHG